MSHTGMSYQLYPSDLTDREWEYIKHLIPAAKSGGRKRQTDMRLTVNAIFYINSIDRGVPSRKLNGGRFKAKSRV